MISNTSVRRKLTENLRRIADRVESACGRARREPSDVSLLIVTKYVDVDMVRTLLDMGHIELGESRVQQLTQRAGMISEYRSRLQSAGAGKGLPEPRWHMIGHLQRNKVKAVLPHVVMVHSVDSLRLAEEISAQASKRNLTTDVLLEVNAGQEKAKSGLAVGAVTHLAEQVYTLPGMRLRGLMCMAPLTEETERIRRAFARTREVFEEIRSEQLCGPEFRHLSMGMTNDYPIAVEEGATIIRVGSAVFEGLKAPE